MICVGFERNNHNCWKISKLYCSHDYFFSKNATGGAKTVHRCVRYPCLLFSADSRQFFCQTAPKMSNICLTLLVDNLVCSWPKNEKKEIKKNKIISSFTTRFIYCTEFLPPFFKGSWFQKIRSINCWILCNLVFHFVIFFGIFAPVFQWIKVQKIIKMESDYSVIFNW